MSSIVMGSDIEKSLVLHGRKHLPLSQSHAAIGGQFHITKTVSDILVHVSDATELSTASTSCERSNELTIGVLLEGKLRFALDEQEVLLEVALGERPLCFAFNCLRPVQWRRDLLLNNHVKKALVCIPHDWLNKRFERSATLDLFVKDLLTHHNLVIQCPAAFQLHKISSSMLHGVQNDMSEIEIEGLALLFLSESLRTLKNRTSEELFPTGHTQASVESLRICHFLEKTIIGSHPPAQVDLPEIARQLGVSISTAQRQFKQDFKMTIMEYIRVRRLEIARSQLQNQVSIGEVAYMAGYTYVSNFSLAFKKRFGASPGDIANSCDKTSTIKPAISESILHTAKTPCSLQTKNTG